MLLRNYVVVFCFSVLFTMCNLFCAAQTGEVKGIITDSAGNPVGYASIILEGANLSTISDQLGIYTIKRIKKGTYNLRISCAGFDSLVKTIKVKENATSAADIQLQVSLSVLRDVTVNSVRTISGMGRLDEMHDGAVYSG